MENKLRHQRLARTKYTEGFWLVWKTGFNVGFMTLPLDVQEKMELKNDIQVILENDKGERLGDAICHYGSYGVQEGLWEAMIDSIPKSYGDCVMGYLTWKEVEKLFDKKIRKLMSENESQST